MSEPWPVSAEQHLHLARRFVAAAVEAEHDMRIVRHNTRVIRRRYAEARATADALAAKIETMLRDEEDARALRLAEHAAREDVAGKLAGALERITMAAGEIARYGMTDGSHHKQWLLDRVLRLMLAEEQYTTWIAAMNSDPDYAPWDVGIAP